MNLIYSNIREIRMSKKISQQRMANRLNIVVSAYSKIERGITPLTVERMGEVAKILQVSVDYLLNFHTYKAADTPNEKIEIDPRELDEIKEELLAVYKYQVENIIYMEYEGIMMKYPQHRVPYEEAMEYWTFDEVYEFNGHKITCEEDYLNAPPFFLENSYEDHYAGFCEMMVNLDITGFFEFGLYPDQFKFMWETWKKDNPEGHNNMRYRRDPKLISKIFNSTVVDHRKLFFSIYSNDF